MKFIRNAVFRLQNEIEETLSSFSNVVRQIFIYTLTFFSLFWLSVFFHGTFYFYYVPVVAQEKAVYFRFRVCDDGVGMCTFPTANISLSKDGRSEVFKRGQIYKLILDMDMPESDVNRNLGMFMVEMSLYNKTGEPLHSAAKPGTLKYKSSLLQMLELLAFSPFYLFGYMEQKQALHVELFPEYKDHPYNPCVGTVLTIQSLKVEIYTATLKIFAQFSGIRYFLYYWPITSAVIGVSWNFMLLSFITVLSWYAFRKGGKKPEDCKQVIKLDMKRRPEGSPRKPRRGITDRPDTPETVGNPSDSREETSLLQPGDRVTDDDSLLRQRQPYAAS